MSEAIKVHPDGAVEDIRPDPVGQAVDKVESDAIAEAEGKVVRASFTLSGGRQVSLMVPHPFTADDMESVIVVLLQMRAASEARQEAEAPLVLPKAPGLVDTSGRTIASGVRVNGAPKP